MTDKDSGGSAFPWCGDLNETPTINLGMTLRDWFAGQALAAIAGPITMASQHSIDQAGKGDGFSGTRGEYTAWRAYAVADAMIAERKK